MIYSMTGYGAASVRDEGVSVSVELKAVNNRFLKFSLRISEGFTALESGIESQIRRTIQRGTVNVSVRIRREKAAADCHISRVVLQSYFERLLEVGSSLGLAGEHQNPRLDLLAALPGVIETDTEIADDENERISALVSTAIEEALEQLQSMRRIEGEAMVRDLTDNITQLRRGVGEVEKQAPNVAPHYRQRLTERIEKLLVEKNLTLNETDLVREVALFADRCDISEEIVRFRSHLEQFETVMRQDDQCGKKLDFLTQELFRETNTMGSKANDAEIIRQVVDMKTVIERIREMIQNIE